MSANTSIEWTDRTWNCVTGCTKVSAGCKNCYAETIAKRLWPVQYHVQAEARQGRTPRVFTDVWTHEDRLREPLSWRKPARVFVNSMSDLFHEDVPDAFIDKVFAVMALAERHTFQVLTKRADRMRAYVTSRNGFSCGVWYEAEKLKPSPPPRHWYHVGRSFSWPLPNVWLGPSVENEPMGNLRFPIACQLGEAGWNVMVSMEPLLSSVTLPDRFLALGRRAWVIVGGESGPGARPHHLEWAESIARQCEAAGTAFFMKQAGQNAYYCGHRLEGITKKGGNLEELPISLRVRQFPAALARPAEAGR